MLGLLKDMLDTDVFVPTNSFFNSIVWPREKLMNSGD